MTVEEMTLVSAIASGIGAVAAAVATVVLAWLTARYVRLTSRLVEETQAARAPEVVVDLQFEDAMPRLMLANRGPTPAYDVRIKVVDRKVAWTPSKDETTIADLAPIKKGISFLPPGRMMRYTVYSIDLQRTLEAEAALEFDVSYKDDAGRAFHREYSIEFAAFNYMLIEGATKPHDVVAEAIRRAAEHLKPRNFFLSPRRACPVCCEQILAEARKCPHCLEAVEPLPPPVSKHEGPST